jgi:hypothetical protein
MQTVKLTGKNAIEFLRQEMAWSICEPVPGLNIAGNEVDGDGVENATLEQAIDACDADPSLVEYTLTEQRADATFQGMAEAAARCYAQLILAGLESRTGTVGVHGVTVHVGTTTPQAVAASRLYAGWDPSHIDWDEIIPHYFSDYAGEIRALARQEYMDYMRENSPVLPATSGERLNLMAIAAGLE